jgi:hypothetical protein
MRKYQTVVRLTGTLLYALCVYGCSAPDSHSGQVVAPQQVASSAAPQQQKTWDERSDCYPGAPPNSLADALDPLKAHCDRAAAIGKIALLAAAIVVPEALAGEGAAVGAIGSDAAGAGAAVDAARAGGALAAEDTAAGQVSYSARAIGDGEHEVSVIGENGEAQSEPYRVARGREGSHIVRNSAGEGLGSYDVQGNQSDYTVSRADGTVRRTRAYPSDNSTGSQDSGGWTYIPR